MCVKPTRIYVEGKPSLTPREVPCRKCWACTKNRVSALVGKVLMEQETVDWSYMLTLTYDPQRLTEHPWGDNAAKFICKADFQEFMRNVRSQMRSQDRKNKTNIGSNARYLVAGEYGELKGRSHFHVLLMGTGMPPPIPKLKKNYQYMPAWRWGYTFAELAQGERSIRYIAKYLTKAVSEKERQKNNPTAQAWVSYSRLPPMGTEYVKKMAVKHASNKIMPYDLKFMPPGGNPDVNYSITGKQELIFFQTMFDHWPEMIDKPCHEWIYNARLRWIRSKALDEWENLTVQERHDILTDALRTRRLLYKPYVPDASNDEKDWLLAWQEGQIAQIEQSPPLLDHQHRDQLRAFYQELNRAICHRLPKHNGRVP